MSHLKRYAPMFIGVTSKLFCKNWSQATLKSVSSESVFTPFFWEKSDQTVYFFPNSVKDHQKAMHHTDPKKLISPPKFGPAWHWWHHHHRHYHNNHHHHLGKSASDWPVGGDGLFIKGERKHADHKTSSFGLQKFSKLSHIRFVWMSVRWGKKRYGQTNEAILGAGYHLWFGLICCVCSKQ